MLVSWYNLAGSLFNNNDISWARSSGPVPLAKMTAEIKQVVLVHHFRDAVAPVDTLRVQVCIQSPRKSAQCPFGNPMINALMRSIVSTFCGVMYLPPNNEIFLVCPLYVTSWCVPGDVSVTLLRPHVLVEVIRSTWLCGRVANPTTCMLGIHGKAPIKITWNLPCNFV